MFKAWFCILMSLNPSSFAVNLVELFELITKRKKQPPINIPGSLKRRVRRMPALGMLAMRRPRNLSKHKTLCTIRVKK